MASPVSPNIPVELRIDPGTLSGEAVILPTYKKLVLLPDILCCLGKYIHFKFIFKCTICIAMSTHAFAHINITTLDTNKHYLHNYTVKTGHSCLLSCECFGITLMAHLHSSRLFLVLYGSSWLNSFKRRVCAEYSDKILHDAEIATNVMIKHK